MNETIATLIDDIKCVVEDIDLKYPASTIEELELAKRLIERAITELSKLA